MLDNLPARVGWNVRQLSKIVDLLMLHMGMSPALLMLCSAISPHRTHRLHGEVQRLLRLGADPNAKDEDGKSALERLVSIAPPQYHHQPIPLIGVDSDYRGALYHLLRAKCICPPQLVDGIVRYLQDDPAILTLLLDCRVDPTVLLGYWMLHVRQCGKTEHALSILHMLLDKDARADLAVDQQQQQQQQQPLFVSVLTATFSIDEGQPYMMQAVRLMLEHGVDGHLVRQALCKVDFEEYRSNPDLVLELRRLANDTHIPVRVEDLAPFEINTKPSADAMLQMVEKLAKTPEVPCLCDPSAIDILVQTFRQHQHWSSIRTLLERNNKIDSTSLQLACIL